MRFRRWQILSNIALRLQIFSWKSNLQFRFLFCRNIIVEFTLISSKTVTSTLRGKCTLASQTFFRSNVEKFECSSRERATRYDRNIRACDWIDIRDRAYSAPLSLSFAPKKMGKSVKPHSERNLFPRIPLCIPPIAPISFVVFSFPRFSSHRSLLAYRKGIRLPIVDRFGDSGKRRSSRSRIFGETGQIGV